MRMEIHYFTSLASTFDKAFEMLAEGKLNVWDSVMAGSQTEGRGQMRRHWDSPQGNIYISMRLPETSPFNSTAASIALSTLCARSLRALGWKILLKWPNDLIMQANGEYKKTGGILLEERDGRIMGGIGLNLVKYPQVLRGEGTMPATCLNADNDNVWKGGARELWEAIVKNMLEYYKSAPSFAENWRGLAESLLIWRENQIDIVDGDQIHTGILSGLACSGALILKTAKGKEAFLSGSPRPHRA